MGQPCLQWNLFSSWGRLPTPDRYAPDLETTPMRPPSSARRTALAATLGLLASLVTTVVAAGPANAEQVFERPASGVR